MFVDIGNDVFVNIKLAVAISIVKQDGRWIVSAEFAEYRSGEYEVYTLFTGSINECRGYMKMIYRQVGIPMEMISK